MSIKQEPDTVIENVKEVEPDSSDSRNRKNKIINEDSLLQVKTECYMEEEDSALPNSIKSHELWLDFIKTDMSDQVSTLDDSGIDKGSSQRDDQWEPGCSDRDVKIKNAECLPQVKTECFHEEDGRVLNSIKSEEQRLNFNIPDIEEQINIAHISSCQEGYQYNSDSLQKTRVLPNNLQASYTYVTGTHCENQDMPSEDGKECLVHCSQMVVKCDLNIPTDNNTDDKICVSRDVKNFHKYFLTSDNVSPSQQDQVKLYECVTCPYSSNHLFELHQHKTSHKMEHFYVCDLCQSTYQYFLDLKCHLKSHRAQDDNSLQLFYGSKKYSSVIKSCQDVQRGDKIYRQDNICTENDSEFKHTSPYGIIACKIACKPEEQRESQTGLGNSLVRDISKYQSIEQRKSPSDKTYGCSQGEYVCRRIYKLKQPKTKHAGKKQYSCDLCNYASKWSANLRRHKRKHRGKKPYSCDLCDFTCSTGSNLKQHKRKHTDKKPYSCDLCGYASAYSGYLKQHKTKHTGEKPYSCDLCDYACAFSRQLKLHKRKHTGEKPYSCDLCDFTCTCSANLSRHKRKHTGEKPYTCNLCDFTCAHSCYLKTHKRTHTGQKPYSCDFCDFTCAHPSSFRRHKLRKHTDKKPHCCDVCDFTCAQSSDLKEHKRKHIAKKIYSCDLCDYACAYSCNLKVHKRTHTGEKPYTCDLCGFTCAQSGHLQKHKRTHTGEKPYTCGLCGFTCAQLTHLKEHERTHTGEKPYSCDLCDFTCAHSANLSRHKRKHTGDKT